MQIRADFFKLKEGFAKSGLKIKTDENECWVDIEGSEMEINKVLDEIDVKGGLKLD